MIISVYLFPHNQQGGWSIWISSGIFQVFRRNAKYRRYSLDYDYGFKCMLFQMFYYSIPRVHFRRNLTTAVKNVIAARSRQWLRCSHLDRFTITYQPESTSFCDTLCIRYVLIPFHCWNDSQFLSHQAGFSVLSILQSAHSNCSGIRSIKSMLNQDYLISRPYSNFE
ncbi:hypothetical protein Tcan_00928, partial [Toxocara canis]